MNSKRQEVLLCLTWQLLYAYLNLIYIVPQIHEPLSMRNIWTPATEIEGGCKHRLPRTSRYLKSTKLSWKSPSNFSLSLYLLLPTKQEIFEAKAHLWYAGNPIFFFFFYGKEPGDRAGHYTWGKRIFQSNWKGSVPENARFGIVSRFWVDFQFAVIFIPTD